MHDVQWPVEPLQVAQEEPQGSHAPSLAYVPAGQVSTQVNVTWGGGGLSLLQWLGTVHGA